MKIGIDLTPLQGPHKLRGIGATLMCFINNLSEQDKRKNEFVFYVLNQPENSALDSLRLDDINYETRLIKPSRQLKFKLPGKLSVFNNMLVVLQRGFELRFGSTRFTHAKELDAFLQFDQAQTLPAKYKVPSTVMLYDVIPYVLEYDYLPGYKTARLKGHSLKGSLRCAYRRRQYKANLKRVCKRAKTLIAISEYTKKDFVKYIGVKDKKIKVCHLGVKEFKETDLKDVQLTRFKDTSWGPIATKLDLAGKHYLLFVGGADQRRKLVDLVTAFNNLVARGEDIYLVLAGDTMYSASGMVDTTLRNYLKSSSYLNKIFFMGFVNDDQREWLYKNALAFVYPSIYEGFGLPILEAMQYGTPVIAYKNSSITEVAGEAAIYAEDHLSIANSVKQLIEDPKLKDKYSKLGKAQTAKFSWQKTTKNIFKIIVS